MTTLQRICLVMLLLLASAGSRSMVRSFGSWRVLNLRGGSAATNNVTASTEPAGASPPSQSTTQSVLVSTTIGSSFLDKKKRITVPKNCSVLEVKQQVQRSFPGSPPVELQRLFFGMRLLSDDEVVGNLSTLNPVPIMLDMLTGTSVYNKTMSVAQAVEAYASIAVQQSFVGDRLKALFAPPAGISPDDAVGTATAAGAATAVMDTAIYRDMFEAINASLYNTYAQDIREALVDEQEPETLSADTASWRHARKDKSPITVALAKEFDLNLRGIKNFGYYSVLLAVFAAFGTTTQAASKLLVLLVPFLWISKLRQLRLAFKLTLNLLLPVIAKVDFLTPLLAAPYQVLATEAHKIGRGEGENDDEDDEDEAIVPRAKSRKQPVVPVAKRKGLL